MEKNITKIQLDLINNIEDRPKWNADMEYWLNDELTVLDNPGYLSADGSKYFQSVIISGEINTEQPNE